MTRRHSVPLIGHKPCPTCEGAGKVPIYAWPPECTAECAASLRDYQSGGQYYLCFRHGLLNSVLWTPEERERALARQGMAGLGEAPP